MAKTIAVCSHCGSHDVRADAYAEWDVQSQQWELAQTFEKGAFCGKCDGETTVAWAPIPSAQETLFPLQEDDRTISERNVASPL